MAEETAAAGGAVAPATAAAPAKKKSPVNNPYIWGTGRRKSAVARVRIKPGEGKFLINDREVKKYFRVERDQHAVRFPLELTGTSKALDVFVNVRGGGITGQTGAVVLGLARALSKYDESLSPKLKEQRLLSRDPRKVERKKYGQSGARRRFQFSKR